MTALGAVQSTDAKLALGISVQLQQQREAMRLSVAAKHAQRAETRQSQSEGTNRQGPCTLMLKIMLFAYRSSMTRIIVRASI